MEIGLALLYLLAGLGIASAFLDDGRTCETALAESFSVCGSFFSDIHKLETTVASIQSDLIDLRSKTDLLSVRLVNGTSYRGEVEIFVDGHWGAICDQDWDQNDANVVCRMLGYNRSRAVMTGRVSSSPYLASNVRCTGNEGSIFQCSRQFSGRYLGCDFNRAAGVDCEMGIRLAGSSQDNHRGRVEVQHLGEWGTICDPNWTVNDAEVVCRMLGFSGGRAVVAATFGAGTGRIILSNPNCRGNENHLMDCQHVPFRLHSCTHSSDVSVVCDPSV